MDDMNKEHWGVSECPYLLVMPSSWNENWAKGTISTLTVTQESVSVRMR